MPTQELLPAAAQLCCRETVVCWTELSRKHADASLFMENGIDILTVKEFVRGFMGKTVDHQANTKLCKLSFVTYDAVQLYWGWGGIFPA